HFFFQAEDGIRDRTVTGVQTCALPIYERSGNQHRSYAGDHEESGSYEEAPEPSPEGAHLAPILHAVAGVVVADHLFLRVIFLARSEERRVGKECRSRLRPGHGIEREAR